MGLQTGCLAFPLSTQGGALNFPCLAERQVFTIWDNKEIDIQRDAGAGASHLVPNHPLPSRSVAFSFQALFFGGALGEQDREVSFRATALPRPSSVETSTNHFSPLSSETGFTIHPRTLSLEAGLLKHNIQRSKFEDLNGFIQ